MHRDKVTKTGKHWYTYKHAYTKLRYIVLTTQGLHVQLEGGTSTLHSQEEVEALQQEE